MTSSPINAIPISSPQTPTAYSPRERSETILTTSSSDSFPHLQTPQTSSILGVLNGHQAGSYKPSAVVESATDALTISRHRQNSYGFGSALISSSPETIPQDGHINPSFVEEHQSLFTNGTSPQLGPSIQLSDHSPNNVQPISTLSPTSSTNVDLSEPDASRLSISTDGTVEHSDATTASRRSKLKAVVRRKLERSKSSLRSLRRSKEDDGDSTLSSPSSLLDANGITPSSSINNTVAIRPRKSRLKSLLTISRAPSSTSVRSTHVTSASHSPTFSKQAQPSHQLPHHIGHHEITVRDFAHPPSAVFPASARTRHFSIDGVAQLDQFTTPAQAICKYVSNSTEVPTHQSNIANDSSYTHPVRITRPRATSMPLLDTTAADLMGDESGIGIEEKTNYFDTVLPRELRLLVMKTLVEVYKAEGGIKRWSGETGGRRELIKLSRVSKSWQQLCLDGQLWSSLELSPYAHVLHPNTLKRILSSSLPFITIMDLRGLNRLKGSALIPSLSPFDWTPSPRSDSLTVWLPNLRVLDLRGANRLSPSDICSIILGSPGLKFINLKAVQACSSEVIRTIARSTRQLEYLDISRCKDLTLGDIIFLVNAMDDVQASQLKALRFGGLKSYGRHASDLLPLLAKTLISLEVLDAQGCTHLFDDGFEKFALAHQEVGRKSSITHLNLSGCTALKGEFLVHLAGYLPQLRFLELANLSEMFKDNHDDSELDLVKFLKTIPKIEKIDLDQTGTHGGITDRVLDVLSRYRSDESDETVGKNLKELRIGGSKDVTSEGLCRLIRSCGNLGVLEIDNTPADNSVLRTFLKYHPKGNISVIDCRSITTSELDKLLKNTRTRVGYEGWAFTPFEYQTKELSSEGGKTTVKSFQGWRNTTIPRDWREIRNDLDKVQHANDEGVIEKDKEKEKKERKNSWWSSSPTSTSSGGTAVTGMMDLDGVWEGEGDGEGGGRGCVIM
ncbi:hypothetical protein L486_03047 [Kwoniella mangroviensis CBS 10435]|uniref:F-box domain-containing protein n=1 Tax=Kwoniella mangroviensis CBS 10435 TaxID=1331196 RepID=A0A1B9IY54_9TREE|nr:hypothetical protein L486_03047 [Kwoniella mangroviensis CBS 10435]